MTRRYYGWLHSKAKQNKTKKKCVCVCVCVDMLLGCGVGGGRGGWRLEESSFCNQFYVTPKKKVPREGDCTTDIE